jgi:hypothetical protein
MSVLILSSVIPLLIALATATSPPGETSGGKKQLSRDQARTVVLTFLKSQGYKTESPKFDLESDPGDPDLPEFYMFHAYYDTPTRLNSIGTYAVSRKTAALWERVACEQLKSKALAQLQRKLRREIGLSGSHGGGPSAKPCF